jgi:hypothetical protein
MSLSSSFHGGRSSQPSISLPLLLLVVVLLAVFCFAQSNAESVIANAGESCNLTDGASSLSLSLSLSGVYALTLSVLLL